MSFNASTGPSLVEVTEECRRTHFQALLKAFASEEKNEINSRVRKFDESQPVGMHWIFLMKKH